MSAVWRPRSTCSFAPVRALHEPPPPNRELNVALRLSGN